MSIDPLNQPMVDGRQSETALAVQQGTTRLLRQLGFAVLPEFPLANGRRADLIGINDKGVIWIVEIKSSVQDFRSDQKWPDYGDYCDRFFFAIPLELDPDIIPFHTGLILADRFGAELVRTPPEFALHASRRKAVTLRFGRTAAHRLHHCRDRTVAEPLDAE